MGDKHRLDGLSGYRGLVDQYEGDAVVLEDTLMKRSIRPGGYVSYSGGLLGSYVPTKIKT